MLKYYPAQIVPLNLKLSELPISIHSMFPDPLERLRICEEYEITSVSQYGESVEVVIENTSKDKIKLNYLFDQCIYIKG